jgi:tRNA A37 threonylcarbamoyladenosine synthetase subunit TsaC/SUA5/YrdC
MQFKFKRHQKVIILVNPDLEYIEYDPSLKKEREIKKGMEGEINIILPNGKYHVKIMDKKGKTIAYAPFNEEDLGAAE